MISFEQASLIARREIEQRRQKKIAEGLTVGETNLVREHEAFWTFAAPLPQLQAEGYAPGAIMVSVDKTDGHIWDAIDFARAAREKAETVGV